MSELRVALTFDAEHPDRSECPPGAVDGILAALDRARVRATFFLQGRWVTAYPATARQIAGQGHLIGNHSHYHARMPLLTDDGIRADVLAAAAAIESTTGASPAPWFRCPFGAGSDDSRVRDQLAELGYRNVHWDVDGADWEDDRTADGVRSTIVERTRARGDGAIVLLHTWPAATQAALPRLISELRESARLVTVSELEGL